VAAREDGYVTYSWFATQLSSFAHRAYHSDRRRRLCIFCGRATEAMNRLGSRPSCRMSAEAVQEAPSSETRVALQESRDYCMYATTSAELCGTQANMTSSTMELGTVLDIFCIQLVTMWYAAGGDCQSSSRCTRRGRSLITLSLGLCSFPGQTKHRDNNHNSAVVTKDATIVWASWLAGRSQSAGGRKSEILVFLLVLHSQQ
jgi:hypothetical protein